MMVVLVVTVVLGGVKRVLLVLLCVVLEENYERSAIKVLQNICSVFFYQNYKGGGRQSFSVSSAPHGIHLVSVGVANDVYTIRI